MNNFHSYNLPLGFDNALSLEGALHELIKEQDNIRKEFSELNANERNYTDNEIIKSYNKIIDEVTTIQKLLQSNIDTEKSERINSDDTLDFNIKSLRQYLLNYTNTQISMLNTSLKSLVDTTKTYILALHKDDLVVVNSTINTKFNKVSSDLKKFKDELLYLINHGLYSFFSPFTGYYQPIEKNVEEIYKYFYRFFGYNNKDFFNILKNKGMTVEVFNTMNLIVDDSEKLDWLTVKGFNLYNSLYLYAMYNGFFDVDTPPVIENYIKKLNHNHTIFSGTFTTSSYKGENVFQIIKTSGVCDCKSNVITLPKNSKVKINLNGTFSVIDNTQENTQCYCKIIDENKVGYSYSYFEHLYSKYIKNNYQGIFDRTIIIDTSKTYNNLHDIMLVYYGFDTQSINDLTGTITITTI